MLFCERPFFYEICSTDLKGIVITALHNGGKLLILTLSKIT